MDKIITAVAKPFSTAPRGEYRFLVETTTARVRVWDDVAGYYTTCHSMTARQQERICILAGL